MADPSGGQPAYWLGINWTAVFTTVGSGIAILLSASPTLRAWRKGQADRSTTAAAQALEREKRLDQLAREQYTNVCAELDRAYRRLAELERERDALEADRNAGWDKGRAMQDETIWHRHEHIATLQRVEGILFIMEQNRPDAWDRAKALAAQIVLTRPREVPSLGELRGRAGP